jgi:Holliday junction resolvase-like predicted endonuclease
LIIRDRGVIVAVEVKTGAAAFEHFTDAKIEALRRAMTRLRPAPRRLDLITITPDRGRATIRWYRAAG